MLILAWKTLKRQSIFVVVHFFQFFLVTGIFISFIRGGFGVVRFFNPFVGGAWEVKPDVADLFALFRFLNLFCNFNFQDA